MTIRSNFLPRLSLLLILLLAACTLPVARRAQPVEKQGIKATEVALLVETEIARALNTATPTPQPSATPTTAQASAATAQSATETALANATPAPLVVQITPLAGLELYTHPEVPEYVFQINPNAWEKDPSGETANLVHTSIPDCRIESVAGQGLSAPQRSFWEDWGRFRWEMMDYGSYAYAFPVDGAGLGSQRSSFLSLEGYNRAKCRTAQEKVLADLMLVSEAGGQLGFVPYLSPTPRAALENFTCPDAPEPRLRTGDRVSVVTNALWLRSEPRADPSTKIRQYPRSAPVRIRVIGGPTCEKYVYWQVEVSDFSEGGERTTGWMAEGDADEVYLVRVK